MNTITPRQPSLASRVAARVFPVLALFLVNCFAVSGQASWAYAAFGHSWPFAVAFAATLESIALFLTYEASKAMLNNDRSGTLKLGAYTLGVLVGAMNYAAHSGPQWRPTATAIALGLLSTLSPWLWMIHTRSVHREALREAELIDPRTAKLPLMLWLMYPIKAVRMLRLAVWNGENKPGTVRATFAERAALRGLSGVDAIGYAYGAGCVTPHEARVWLQQRGRLVDAGALGQFVPVGHPPPRMRQPSVSMRQTADPMGHQDETRALTASVDTVSPDAPEAAEPVDLETHRETLAALDSQEQRVHYALETLDTDHAPAAHAWLDALGYPVGRATAYRGAATKAIRGPSGGYPIVPRPNGHRRRDERQYEHRRRGR